MRSAFASPMRSTLRWRWLWQHCLDAPRTITHSRPFALRARTTAARFPSQPRTFPPTSRTPTATSPSSRPRPSRADAPPATQQPHVASTATSATNSAQLALIEAEKLHQPDTALELLPLVDQQQPLPLLASEWAEQLSTATAFHTALVEFAQAEKWSSLLSLYLAHPFYQPLSSIAFIPSTAASQLATEAAMELRDWDKVLRVHVRRVVYERRRLQGVVDTLADMQPTSTVRPTKRVDRTATVASSASAAYRAHACVDCVLYAAYRLGRHDMVQFMFNVRTTPLPSSHTTFILSCAQTRQWQRVEQWLASVDEAVWEEVEMAAVSTAMSAWRLALNQSHSTASHTQQHEQQRYNQSVALVAEWLMRVGAISTPPQPVQWSSDFRVQRAADGQYSQFPLLVRPMAGYVSPLLVSALSATTHYSDEANMAAIVALTLLRMRSHALLSPASSTSSPTPLFSVYFQPPHSSVTGWDVDAAVEALGIRGMSAFVRASEMHAVIGGSEQRKAEEAKRRTESLELFESKGERRRRRMEEEAVRRGELDEEKQWVLEIDAETMQRWLNKTMLPWEMQLLSMQAKQQ